MHDVIVIGGGISGLATAHDLQARGLDVQLLERQVRVGGNAISERFDGFLMEHGPTTFNASVPDAVEQIRSLGLLDQAADLGPDVKQRYLRDNGKLTGISANPMGFFKSDYLSKKARARILLEGLIPRIKSGEDESIHAFVARRFGREFADKVMDPMAAGIFMGDSKQLSISGAFPKLAEMEQELGSITRGILRAKRGTEPGRHLYSWGKGIATIPQTFAAGLGARIHTGVTVTALSKTVSGFAVKTSHGTRTARAIVLAVQPHVAASLLARIDPVGAMATGEIMAPPVNVAFFGYKREQVAHPLDGLGFLSTKDETRILSGAQFASTMYAGRAPDGYVSISAYAGGVRNPELAAMPEAELGARMHKELAEMLGIKGVPVVTKLRRWALGLPQYTIGHTARQTVFEQTPQRVEGLFVTGNYTRGVSVANCMKSAKETAGSVAAALGATRTAAHVSPATG
ncbi:protoporphyrinogen oxidase [Profundibacter sp.]